MTVSGSAPPDRGGWLARRTAAWQTPRVIAGVAVLYVLSHLPLLAPSLEDIDSINFALGLRDFNPALHQPHPPGYPIYIALGRLSLFVVSQAAPNLPPARADALALAVWSAIAGGVALIAAGRLFTLIDRRFSAGRGGRSIVWAVAFLAVMPLFWITGLRPLSDMCGLAVALLAQVWLLDARGGWRRLGVAALFAGAVAGVRLQTLVLTTPMLVFASVTQPQRERLRSTVCAIVSLVAGVLLWAVPSAVASGGLAAYLTAFRQQLNEVGPVEMLWADPSPRRLAFALYETFVLPWGATPLAVLMVGLGIAGAVAAALRARRALLVLIAAFGPYIVYHLLMHETITARYTLPVLPLVAWCIAQLFGTVRRWTPIAGGAVLAAGGVVALSGSLAYAREAHPAFRAFVDARERANADAPAAIYSHYGVRRSIQVADFGPVPVIEPRRQYEWMDLVDYWRAGGAEPVWFFADSKRTDLALIDPQSRRDVRRYRWAVAGRGELGGARPIGVDWYRFGQPGWFAGEGWSLTPEAGGVTAAARSGPGVRPIDAWILRRAEPLCVMIGGRHLGKPGDSAASFELRIDDRLVDAWRLTVAERNFLRFVALPRGLLEGSGRYAIVHVAAHGDDHTHAVPVAIRQFDAQSASQVVYGFGEGWYEEEYSPQTGLRWRWTSDRSVLRIEGPPHPIRLTLRGESPLKYFGAAPTVTIVAGNRTVARFAPTSDFEWTVTVPADVWMASHGAVAIQVDRTYLPGKVERNGDGRRLGLRMYDVRVDGVTP